MLSTVVRSGLVSLAVVFGIALGIAPAANAAMPPPAPATAMLEAGFDPIGATTGGTVAKPKPRDIPVVKTIDKASP